MPTELIVIFLLFAAVLAFAWFYLQRAKVRDAGTTVETAAVDPVVDRAPVETAATSTTTVETVERVETVDPTDPLERPQA
jgi:hypothetical protein